jgi:hypothetical protein
MLADLDLLLTAVFCTADDPLPERAQNARRRVTDAQVVTLAVAQAIMGVTSDDRFLRLAARSLRELFPQLPKQPGFHKRRAKLTETIEWLIGIFAAQSPGYEDNLVLLDSTPVECARSLETVRRSALSDAAGYSYCRSHSRFFLASGCTWPPLRTAPRGRRSSPRPTSPSARSSSNCCRAPCVAASWSSPTRAMPARISKPPSARSQPRRRRAADEDRCLERARRHRIRPALPRILVRIGGSPLPQQFHTESCSPSRDPLTGQNADLCRAGDP